MELSRPTPTLPNHAFGDIAVIGFVIVQALDGALTYLGLHTWGASVEANPLVSSAVSVAGVGGGLLVTKLLAVMLGMLLHLKGVHRAVAFLTIFYVAAAIVPWSLMFLAQ
jgi:hypothetical protein